MTIQALKEISGHQIGRMSPDELGEIAKEMTVRVSQRFGHLRKAEMTYTPAFQTMLPSEVPKFKDIDEMVQYANDQALLGKDEGKAAIEPLKRLVTKERNFLRDQTSTVTGERQRIRSFVELTVEDREWRTKRSLEIEITKRIEKMGGYKAFGDFFEVIEQAKSLDPSLIYEMGTETFMKEAFLEYINGTTDPVELIDKVRQRLDKKLREDQEKSDEFGWDEEEEQEIVQQTKEKAKSKGKAPGIYRKGGKATGIYKKGGKATGIYKKGGKATGIYKQNGKAWGLYKQDGKAQGIFSKDGTAKGIFGKKK